MDTSLLTNNIIIDTFSEHVPRVSFEIFRVPSLHQFFRPTSPLPFSLLSVSRLLFHERS